MGRRKCLQSGGLPLGSGYFCTGRSCVSNPVGLRQPVLLDTPPGLSVLTHLHTSSLDSGWVPAKRSCYYTCSKARYWQTQQDINVSYLKFKMYLMCIMVTFRHKCNHNTGHPETNYVTCILHSSPNVIANPSNYYIMLQQSFWQLSSFDKARRAKRSGLCKE